MNNPLTPFSQISTFVFDIDGVMTSGQLLATETGALLRSMNIKDGFALQWAVKKGYSLWVLSGGRSEGMVSRLSRLGIEEIHTGVEDKRSLLLDCCRKSQKDTKEILYLGDDIPDYEAMICCGLRCAPQDAVKEIKSIAHYISPKAGGQGCVRDVIEKVLKIRGDWFVADNSPSL